MSHSRSEQTIIVLLRLMIGWVFLYAASHQVTVPGWSITGFLSNTKTFNGLFSIFTGPGIAPLVSFMVSYGHLLIGLSLITGLMVRVSAAFGAFLMLLYWMAHMDWPYIENRFNFIVDYHLVEAVILWLLIVKNAGHVAGLDAWAARQDFVRNNRFLRWAIG